MCQTQHTSKLSCNIRGQASTLSFHWIHFCFLPVAMELYYCGICAHSGIKWAPGEGLSLRVGPGRAVVFRDSHPCRAILSEASQGQSSVTNSGSSFIQARAKGEPAAGGANWSPAAGRGWGLRLQARASLRSAGFRKTPPRRRAQVLVAPRSPAAVFQPRAKATAAERSSGAPPPVRPPDRRSSEPRFSLFRQPFQAPDGRQRRFGRGPGAPEASGMVWDRVGGGGCAAPDWRAGTGAGCSQAAWRPRGRRRRLIGASLAVWTGGGGGAVLSPTAAGPGVLGGSDRGGRRPFRCPRLGPVAPEGVAGRRSAPQGWRGVWGPRHAALAGSGHRRALPGCPLFVPPPPTTASTLRRLIAVSIRRRPLGIRGFTTCLHNCTGFYVGLCFLHFCPAVLPPTRTRPRELLLRSGPTPQATCLGSGFLPIESKRLLTCFLILRINWILQGLHSFKHVIF